MALPEQHPTHAHKQPEVSVRVEIAALKRRLTALERENRVPMTTVAAVTGSTGRDGSMAGSSDTPRLWLKVAGTWRYTALT